MCLHIVYSWGILEALGLQNTRSKMDCLVIKKALVWEKRAASLPCTTRVLVSRCQFPNSISLFKETCNVFTSLDNKLSKALNKTANKSSRFIVKQSPRTIRNKSLLISSQSYPALMTQSTFSFYNPFQKTLKHLSGKPWLHLNFSSPKTLHSLV